MLPLNFLEEIWDMGPIYILDSYVQKVKSEQKPIILN